MIAIGAATLALYGTVLLVVVPAAIAEPPRVLSPFGSPTGPEGFRRPAPHDGVDLAATVGTPVIAPADGVVHRLIDDHVCGTGMIIVHGRLATVYCHLSARSVRLGEPVKRGDALGRTGITGQRPDPGFEHLHFEVREGWRYEDPHLDPMPFVVGCYETGRAYPRGRLVLTYPVPCR